MSDSYVKYRYKPNKIAKKQDVKRIKTKMISYDVLKRSTLRKRRTKLKNKSQWCNKCNSFTTHINYIRIYSITPNLECWSCISKKDVL